MKKISLNPHLTVDCVVFAFDGDKLNVLLIERKIKTLDKGLEIADLKFPGNFIYDDEDLQTSAKRVLQELTGLGDIFLEQFFSFGNPERTSHEKDRIWLKSIINQPVSRVITVGFFALINLKDAVFTESEFAQNPKWLPVKEIQKLAFDHNEILDKAIEALQIKIKLAPVIFNLLPEKFTLTELQKCYEAILFQSFDKRNFRKKISNIPYIKALQEKQKKVSHKPAQLYTFDPGAYKRVFKKTPF